MLRPRLPHDAARAAELTPPTGGRRGASRLCRPASAFVAAVALAAVLGGCGDRGLPTASAPERPALASVSDDIVVTQTGDAGLGSLRQGIVAANTDPSRARWIRFAIPVDDPGCSAPGVCTITLATPLPPITNPAGVTIDGSAQTITVSGGNQTRVMRVYPGAAVTMSWLTISGGKAESVSGDPLSGLGGGILNQGTLTIDNATFDGNHASGSGGAIYTSGPLAVENSEFKLNTANLGGGIAIHNDAGNAVTRVNNCTFRNNTATSGGGAIDANETLHVGGGEFLANNGGLGGGAIRGSDGGDVHVSGATFVGNSATGGGAVFNTFDSGMIFEMSFFIDNSAGNTGGGAIFNNGGWVDVHRSTFTNNRTSGSGGAIRNPGPLEVIGSTFNGNSAQGTGGAIVSSASEVTIRQSTFTGNSAAAGAGAIRNTATVLPILLAVTHSTIADNGAPAIQSDFGTVTLAHTIVAGSSAAGSPGADLKGSFTSQGYNLIGVVGTAAGLTHGVNGDQVGTAAAPINPLLGPLANNGGFIDTRALLPGSPATDAGDPAYIDPFPSLPYDQRGEGFDRVINGRIDIGAFEDQTLSQAPIASAGGPYAGDEGSAIALSGATASDSEGDALSYSWSFVRLTPDPAQCEFSDPLALNPTFTCKDDGTFEVTLVVRDNKAPAVQSSTTLTVNNAAPTATFVAPSPVTEGSPIGLLLTAPQDPAPMDQAAGFKYAFDCGDGSGYGPFGSSNAASCPTTDDGVRTVKGKIRDKDGGEREYVAQVTVDNVAPVVGTVTAPLDPQVLSQAISVNTTFADFGANDGPWSYTIEWGDGSTSTGIMSSSSGAIGGTHAYAGPGIYTVKITVSDNDGEPGAALSSYIVVYDPAGGFVTGSGSISSPAGAYAPDPSLTGKASFGFVAKYQKGPSGTELTGRTEFRFRTASFTFASTSYDWLIVSGARARYMGSGTVNGAGDYGFMLTAIDGALVGGGGSDKFRIKIWNKATGVVIYDNQMGDAETADPRTVVETGSIIIHSK